MPTRPRTPRHKGKIESGVDYVKENALKGHVFPSLEEENRHLLDWETTVADLRIHGTIRQQVGKLFAEVERPALQAVAGGAFPVLPRSAAARASRRPRRGGQGLLLGAAGVPGADGVGALGHGGWCASSTSAWSRSPCTPSVSRAASARNGAHLAAEKISGVERGAGWLLNKVRRLGPQSSRWAEA